MERPSSRERRGPQVYVHLEFGLSWNSKPPKNQELKYKSRGFRDRSPAFPRQVPAPNTNYLAAIHDFDQRHPHPNNRTVSAAAVPLARPDAAYPARDHQMQEYYQAGVYLPRRPHQQQPPQPTTQEPRRVTRAESTSSHERGHSAPPPIGDNPWDESIGPSHYVPDGETSRAGAARNSRPPDQWKALPHPPSLYRLGEDGMPWSSWSNPLEYQPEPETPPPRGANNNDDYFSVTSPSVQITSSFHDHVSSYEASAASVSVYSPGPSSNAVRARDAETGRAKELGALSAAMMTVDNGFENQWWNQGPREPVQRRRTDEQLTTLSPPSTAAAADPNTLSRNRWSARSLGWAVAETPDQGGATLTSTLTDYGPQSYPPAASDMISPVTASSSLSPGPRYLQLHRTMSTRSEELWFPERSAI